MLGVLEKVELRSIWKHEEYDFSTWLEANIHILSEQIGISLSVLEREKRVGSYELDLYAEDEEGHSVVIENQLEKTDHDHLGKTITYMTNLNAKTAIWITSKPQQEHASAISWLNEMTPDDISFFLVQVEAYRIGSSQPAPLFTPVVYPSDIAKGKRKEKEREAERYELRKVFWDGLLMKLKEKKISLHSNLSPAKSNMLTTSSGKTGINYSYVVWMKERAGVECSIDTGDKDENKRIFDLLHKKKRGIEKEFGTKLAWERKDDNRSSKIQFILEGKGLMDSTECRKELYETLILHMCALYKSLQQHIMKV